VQDDNSCSLYNDKNWMAVDTFPASPHYGRIYSAWDQLDFSAIIGPLLLRYSDDRGETWSDLVTVSPEVPFLFTVGALPLVQPNGDVTIIYLQQAPVPLRIWAQTSHDGGDTFDPQVLISDYQGTDPPGMRTGLPAAAVDPITGSLYVVWQDARANGDGRNDIVMSASGDGGATWGAFAAVHAPDPVRPQTRFTPAVAAYGGGAVLVAYGTREGEAERAFMRYVVSTDEGLTFGRERGLGRSLRLEFAATADDRIFLGDYIGLTLSSAEAHAVWCRPTRPRGGLPGPHQTTWSATIRR
jgi:hypothetical protein